MVDAVLVSASKVVLAIELSLDPLSGESVSPLPLPGLSRLGVHTQ